VSPQSSSALHPTHRSSHPSNNQQKERLQELSKASSRSLDLPDDPMEVDPAALPSASSSVLPVLEGLPGVLPALEGLPFLGRLVDGVHEVVHCDM